MNLREITKYTIVGLGVMIVIVIGYFGLSKILQGSGELKVETVPSGAHIKVDGKDFTSPTKVTNIGVGKHEITTSKVGFKDRTDFVEIVKGKVSEVKFWLYTSEVSPSVFKSSSAEEQKNLSDFEKLTQFLPYSNLHLKIEYVVVGKEPTIKITLYAIINRPDQLENYKKQLKQYGQEALDWIKSKDIDSEKLSIKWLPSDPFETK